MASKRLRIHRRKPLRVAGDLFRITIEEIMADLQYRSA